MMMRLLSGDAPRSRLLALLLALILLALAFAPFLFPGSRSLETAARICVVIVLVASYDLLLGYGGIVSFAHTMFFGMGAYGVAIASDRLGTGYASLALGALAGLVVAGLVALLVALLSLRVRAIFFAMITLAIASAVAVLVSQLSAYTGGEDGMNLRIPRELTPAFRLGEVFGTRITGKILNYYLVFAGCLVLFLGMLRIVNSPFGRVLLAIRENAFRAEAIGYRVVVYRAVASCLSAMIAALAGSLFAIWLRYVGPATTLGMEIMMDILLIVVIGGMGTMYGAVVGTAIFVLAQNYLKTLMGGVADATASLPLIPDLLNPDRWLLWLGLLFILSVYFFPTGIVGRLRGTR
ncbi:MAG TPA: branched-chain amino acid ABC transporter permease [Pararhodobacter sp.]|uniref:branched-chain amino acid ABC transporter permease n=1 Tax=Pararhodobacter sp. TaxID=2127056 RepID=UPI002C031953|nr:branched-chain amino acid ABC transporter permease [Pararhodobacter sp.]HPD94105.1 branched-chain amino acid ABC transporter permease [Pararhodobacter sp.]